MRENRVSSRLRDTRIPTGVFLLVFIIVPDVPRKETRISSISSSQRPKPHPLPLSAFVTSLNTTSSIPAGDCPCIPARFRISPNYDL
jgi:hypothetical protein